MTLDELSIQFDIMYNNISSNQAPGLTEYEKSVFLTQAQEAIILELYKGVYDSSFETTEEVTRYLSFLVKSFTTSQLTSQPCLLNKKETKISLPLDVMFITYQSANINGKDVIVIPTNQDSLFKTLNNPFKGPSCNRVISISEEDKIVLYSTDDITKYYAKYLSTPYPIILEGVSNEGDFEIRGETDSKEIDWLPESLHNQILIRAVQIAKTVWAS
jgi:hypothetical protein